MKKIAFYLPQFHAIPENDEWWGKGFTEWTNVKSAKPQFKGHFQPEVPLNGYYYNLLDERTQEWQSQLALKYGLDGFCYYHYWFEGKLLLEKPMENMLGNHNIQIPFCICWANETWSRTWDGQETSILIKQNYDEDENAWKDHFLYLLPFFKDERYLREEGKPILILYKPQLIEHCKEMLLYWRKLALENGLDGLYIGYQHHSAFNYDMASLGFDFGIEFEPMFTIREIDKEKDRPLGLLKRALVHPKWLYRKIREKWLHESKVYDYDEIWKRILKRKPREEKVFPGAFCAWDNTPRMGNKSTVFYQSSPDKFKKYFKAQLIHAQKDYKAEYIFINAWNEWAEGAHLEPDERNGYGYLEAICERN